MVEQLGFEFKPAVRVGTPMIIGISGASGSGKTYTALELAMGLAGKRKVAFVDTEGRRGLHYADLGAFKFDHLDFQAPYTPARFLAALQQAARAGYAVVIVDSFSDEYVGEGGLVDMTQAELPRVKNTAAAWAMPKAQHKLVIRWLRQSRCHVIFCLRAEEKVRLEKVMKQGKEQTVVVPIGWQPVAEKNVPYEMTTSFLLTPDAPGVPKPIKIQEQHKAFFPLDRPISRQTGEKLAAWCAGGAPPPALPQKEPPPDHVVLDPRETANGGLDAAFDPDDPFGFGYPDDPGPVVAVDGLPMRLNADLHADPEGMKDLADFAARLSEEEPPPEFYGEDRREGDDIAEVDGVPQRRSSGGFYTKAEADEIVNLPDPLNLSANLGWPALADRIAGMIPSLDIADIQSLRELLNAHELKSEAPMLYAKVLGQLIDRERALTKR